MGEGYHNCSTSRQHFRTHGHEYFAALVVCCGVTMHHRESLRYLLGMTVLILCMTLVGGIRPRHHLSFHVPHGHGVRGLIAVSDDTNDHNARPAAPARGTPSVFAPVLAGALLLALKTRRRAYASVPVRRDKRPAQTSNTSLPSD